MTCKPPFCIGELRHSVDVFEKVLADDGAGGQDVTWDIRHVLRCKIRQMSGREIRMYGQLNATAVKVFETWWKDDLEESDRIEFKDENYNIERIENVDEKNRWMRIYAEKGVIT